MIYLVDCGGANLQNLEDVFPDQEHFGGTFYRQCRMSADGVPQLAAVFGECTAGGAYIPALSDEFVMVAGNASIHLGGPQIVRAAISEVVDRDSLGGALLHATVSGVSDHFAADEHQAIAKLRDMVGALNYPQPLAGDIRLPRPPLFDASELPAIVGADLSRPLDQREIIARVVDGSDFHEFKPLYGETIVCGFAHIEGLPVGILANNGVLFSESTLKAVHFIELCDQRDVPLLFLQNTTGFMVGSEAERGGISKNSAKLVYAVSNARVPRYTLVTGGSYGAGNYGMSGRGFRPRFMFMWPNARLGGMNPDVGSSVLMDLRRASISRHPATDEELAAYEADLRNMFETKVRPILLHGAPVGRRHYRPGRHAHGPRPLSGHRCNAPGAPRTPTRVSNVSRMDLSSAPRPIRSVLVANRGEIACRIMKTCRRLGLRSVAVYSDADQHALHVRMADEAHRLGPAAASASYLDFDAVVRAVRVSGADAVHPGYGFLSENPRFVRRCEDEGILFVGPSSAAVGAMGSKIEAKRIAELVSVPTVPGYHGADQSEAVLEREAQRIGFPVLIKASAGGGGRGMRRVSDLRDFAAALFSARNEARSAFGDDAVLLEKFVENPRHLEVQLVGDQHGNIVHLFERDCSVQRNNQKVIEEAPAPNLDDEVRRKLFDRALTLARAIGYTSAGTVEFVMDAGGSEPYFLEMNTRLQVEHPVTEAITGVDLVELQLAVAAGLPLPRRQDQIAASGHAIEVRIAAERPDLNFQPSVGAFIEVTAPRDLRFDSGIEARSEVGLHYDSMLAKLVAHGADRRAAHEALTRGLELTGASSALPPTRRF